MMRIENFETRSAEFVVDMLELGQTIDTGVPQNVGLGPSAAGNVYLFPQDRECSECGDELDEYGEKPDFTELAAKIKRSHGRTLCADCLDEIATAR